VVDQWQAAEIEVNVKPVMGYQFWNTQEISRADSLIEVTTDWLNSTCVAHTEA